MQENKKVSVFAAYQIGSGLYAKMVGDESKNKFDVTPGPMSEMAREIESILALRHKDEIVNGLIIIIHHVQLISSI